MNNKCIGCGAKFQSINIKKIGYVNKDLINPIYCERCFKIKNYGRIDTILEPFEYEKIIYDIDHDKEAGVIFLIDILNITSDSIKYLKYFSNNIFVVLTKRDILPKSVKDNKIISYFKNNCFNVDNIMCISSNKKYNIDKFLDKLHTLNLKKYYCVGATNSGKSTFINALLGSKGLNQNIVTSSVPNTTCDYINLNIDGINIIDTPGYITESSIYNFLKLDDIEKIIPKKEIKVKTIQIKSGYSCIIDKILRIDYVEGGLNSFSFYMNNNLKYEKVKLEKNDKLKVLPKVNLKIEGNEDIVINGLGFIKIVKESKVVVYTLDEKMISKRKKMI
jgi:30S ribosome assembly GTPase